MSGARKFDWRGAVDWSARAIVQLWPRDTKDWGRAFVAKLLESEGFSASMQWLIGGALLLMREHFRSFWKSPSAALKIHLEVLFQWTFSSQ